MSKHQQYVYAHLDMNMTITCLFQGWPRRQDSEIVARPSLHREVRHICCVKSGDRVARGKQALERRHTVPLHALNESLRYCVLRDRSDSKLACSSTLVFFRCVSVVQIGMKKQPSSLDASSPRPPHFKR